MYACMLYGLHFSRSGDVIHPQLLKHGSGYKTTPAPPLLATPLASSASPYLLAGQEGCLLPHPHRGGGCWPLHFILIPFPVADPGEGTCPPPPPPPIYKFITFRAAFYNRCNSCTVVLPIDTRTHELNKYMCTCVHIKQYQ